MQVIAADAGGIIESLLRKVFRNSEIPDWFWYACLGLLIAFAIYRRVSRKRKEEGNPE
ncbi:MAG: hypothetical protein ACON5N_04890 [Akkermansiaceae bacterium]